MALIDLSFKALFATPAGYKVTGQFDGLDLINGGKHQATDVGNFGSNDPILSPITGKAMGMAHFDGALGVDYDIGNGWHVQLWHLNATLAPIGIWVDVNRGQVCGRTGNTGVQPMPAHTHVELERAGVRYDIEPYLLGRPFDTEDEEMQVTAIVTEQWNTRTGPDQGWFVDRNGNRKHFTGVEQVWTVAELIMQDGTSARLVSYGPTGEPLIMPRNNLLPIAGTRSVGVQPAAKLQLKITGTLSALEGADAAIAKAFGILRS